MSRKVGKNNFTDLNILYKQNESRELIISIIKFAFQQLGYSTVAVNCEQLYSYAKSSNAACSKRKRQQSSVPEPFVVDPTEIDILSLESRGERLRVFSRLTLVVNSVERLQELLSNKIISNYDIIAVCPLNETTFDMAASDSRVHLLTTDVTADNFSLFQGNRLNEAVRNGKYIEISYSPAIMDTSIRKEHKSLMLFRTIGEKGIILTSRATRPMEMRAPYDVINISHLFGMNTNESRSAITVNPQQLLLAVEDNKSKPREQDANLSLATTSNVRFELLKKLSQVPEFNVQMEFQEMASKKLPIPLDDLITLVAKVSERVSLSGTTAHYRRFKFENVLFKDYSAKDLRKVWRMLRLKAYGEHNLVQDVQAIEEYIAKLQPPATDRPKKPLTAYVYYVTKRYSKMRSKNPTLTNLELVRILAEEWRKMDVEKKRKYQRHYESKKEDYNRQMEEFYEKHPELRSSHRGRNVRKKEKATVSNETNDLPFMKFMESRSKKYSEKYGLKGKDLRDKLRCKFENLSDEKRRKWILRAENSEDTYVDCNLGLAPIQPSANDVLLFMRVNTLHSKRYTVKLNNDKSSAVMSD
ncbi:Ribonuclease P protein subunit p30 [Trichinella murrelli]|uniref:Ribonuclease P protein subunit p30 n=1 Tax=Trichinella murrelli TaxID=144512 RepID=A0A0V0T636_9BILA|nr:Ribonuclease P protein subunit p30 [Trichinella murrelli]